MSKSSNILFIDKNNENVNKLLDFKHEFNFIYLNNLEESVRTLDKSEISLIIINNDLIEQSDSKTFSILRSIALHRNIYFIYLSNEDKFLTHRFNSFCIDVLALPIHPEQLLSRIGLALTDHREKMLFQGLIEDYSIDIIIKNCEHIIFTGIIILKCNYETAKLMFENGRLERAIMDIDTDWKALDKILMWRTGKFQIFGNVDKYADNVFMKQIKEKKSEKKEITVNKEALDFILKEIKKEMRELMGIAVIDQKSEIISQLIIVDLVKPENHNDAIKQIINDSKMMLLSLNSHQLNEIVIVGDMHHILVHKIGYQKLFFIAYIKRSANLGMLRIVLQNYENKILALFD